MKVKRKKICQMESKMNKEYYFFMEDEEQNKNKKN